MTEIILFVVLFWIMVTIVGLVLNMLQVMWPFALGFCASKWYFHWRYKDIKPGEWLRVWKPHKGIARVVYLGRSNDGTIRYWFDGSNIVPQGVRRDDWLWDSAYEVNDWEQVFHLRGFQAMGTKWPEFWETEIRHTFDRYGDKPSQDRVKDVHETDWDKITWSP